MRYTVLRTAESEDKLGRIRMGEGGPIFSHGNARNPTFSARPAHSQRAATSACNTHARPAQPGAAARHGRVARAASLARAQLRSSTVTRTPAGRLPGPARDSMIMIRSYSVLRLPATGVTERGRRGHGPKDRVTREERCSFRSDGPARPSAAGRPRPPRAGLPRPVLGPRAAAAAAAARLA